MTRDPHRHNTSCVYCDDNFREMSCLGFSDDTPVRTTDKRVRSFVSCLQNPRRRIYCSRSSNVFTNQNRKRKLPIEQQVNYFRLFIICVRVVQHNTEAKKVLQRSSFSLEKDLHAVGIRVENRKTSPSHKFKNYCLKRNTVHSPFSQCYFLSLVATTPAP